MSELPVLPFAFCCSSNFFRLLPGNPLQSFVSSFSIMENTIKAGDIRWSGSDRKFHPFKVLKVDAASGAYHVLSYVSISETPSLQNFSDWKVLAYHVPVEDLSGTEFLINRPVKEEELQGYFYYLKTNDFERYCAETNQSTEARIAQANEAYRAGSVLSDEKRNAEAIAKYAEAVDCFPLFYEAIDNMAFVKMNMMRWQDAIDDFRWSLDVNPQSVLAEFSIGECYYRMLDYASALEQFERVLAIDPKNELALLFREKTMFLLEGGTLEELEQYLNIADEPDAAENHEPVMVLEEPSPEFVSHEAPESKKEVLLKPEKKKPRRWWPF